MDAESLDDPDELAKLERVNLAVALYWLRSRLWDVDEALLLACGINPAFVKARGWIAEVLLLGSGDEPIDAPLEWVPDFITSKEARRRWDLICHAGDGLQYGDRAGPRNFVMGPLAWLALFRRAGFMSNDPWPPAIQKASWLAEGQDLNRRPRKLGRADLADASSRGGLVSGLARSDDNKQRDEQIATRHAELVAAGKTRNAAAILASDFNLTPHRVRQILKKRK